MRSTGGRIFLKLLSFCSAPVSSKAFRGACNRLAMIPQSARPQERGGRFPPAITPKAWRQRRHCSGMPALIVMPSDAPKPKIEGTRALGAQIVTYDRVREDREAIAAKICAERGAVLVKPFDACRDYRRAGHGGAGDRQGGGPFGRDPG